MAVSSCKNKSVANNFELAVSYSQIIGHCIVMISVHTTSTMELYLDRILLKIQSVKYPDSNRKSQSIKFETLIAIYLSIPVLHNKNPFQIPIYVWRYMLVNEEYRFGLFGFDSMVVSWLYLSLTHPSFAFVSVQNLSDVLVVGGPVSDGIRFAQWTILTHAK